MGEGMLLINFLENFILKVFKFETTELLDVMFFLGKLFDFKNLELRFKILDDQKERSEDNNDKILIFCTSQNRGSPSSDSL